jgi:UDP-N-acetyl-D-glucosamine dehydrogenase
VNDNMPYYVVARAMTALEARGRTLSGARTLVLGLAYKKDISDARESPALKVMELLEKRGAEVIYHDPNVPQVTLVNPGGTLTSAPLTDETLSSVDCVIIATDHTAVDYAMVVATAPLVIDTRNVLRGYRSSNVVRL